MKHLQVILTVAIMLSMTSLGYADSPRQATLLNVSGDVMVRQGAGDWQAASNGMALKPSDEVKTSDGATAELLLDQGNVGNVKIREKSQLKIDSLDLDSSGDKTTYLNLAIGKILIDVEKLQGNSKFEVRTPTSTTGVRGTNFEVAVE